MAVKFTTRLALRLAGLRMPATDREFQLGDLAEEFDDRATREGRRAAERWLWRQAWRCLVHRAGERTERGADEATPARGPIPGLSRDLRFALRLAERTPLISVATVMTMALGVGANTAIFSVAWPLFGARLAFPDESRLAFILLSVERRSGAQPNPLSPGDYFNLLHARSFERLAGFNMFATHRNLSAAGTPRHLRVGTVTEDFFGVLGIQPIAGRLLDARDFGPGHFPLVLNERAWRRDFGANPAIAGTTVRLDNEAWTVVGVAPSSATVGTIDVDAWSSQPLDRATAREKRSVYLAMISRLRPGVSFADANAELATLMRAVAERYPATNKTAAGTPFLARAEPLRERVTGPLRPVFLLLIGGAALVLLVAGANLTGLQVARHLARRPELAVRRALGATRVQLLRQLTTESLVLSVAGGAAGLGAAALTLAGLSRLAPVVAWHDVSPHLTLPVVLFTVAVTLVAGLSIGLVPALVASRHSAHAPADTRGGTAGRALVRIRTAIVAAQVAVAVVLIIAAALSAASLLRVLSVDPGFEIERGLIADVRPAGSQGGGIAFFDALVERVEALPGVERACALNNVPLDNDGATMTFVAEGATDADMRVALPMGVTDGCFDALRIPVVAGRGFFRRESESVAIVNESMARALWPDGSDPVGRRVHIGLVSGPLFRVVGVVGDIHASGLESTFTRQVWMSASRGWPMPQRLIVRSHTPPEALAPAIRGVLADLSPALALGNLRTMDAIVGSATASRRFVIVVLAGFATITLVLCAVGVYGLLAYQVGQRAREIGIRVALGARRRDVARAVVAQTATGVLAGIGAGLAGAWALSSVLATQLFRMSATDRRVYVAVAAFVAIIAVLASWPPARRAARLNPVDVLKN